MESAAVTAATGIESSCSLYRGYGRRHGVLMAQRRPGVLSFDSRCRGMLKEVMRLNGSTLQFSTAYHPQSDGQSEVVNKTLETYLHCFCSQQQQSWSKWLSWAEFWYKSSVHSSTGMSPFEALYGVPPPTVATYLEHTTRAAAVDEHLHSREQILALLHFNLSRAQNRMKQNADKKRSDKQFSVGSWIYLKLQPYRQGSVVSRRNLKLSSQFYGPFCIKRKVGSVAYELILPAGSKIM